MTMVLWIGLIGAGAIGFVTAWRWMHLRLEALTQSLELRLKLRERDLRLAEERLRRLEAERWRPVAVASVPIEASPSMEPVEVDADGLPKRSVPAAVQAELLGLQHTCVVQAVELEQTRRDLMAQGAQLSMLRAALDAESRRVESAESGRQTGDQAVAGG